MAMMSVEGGTDGEVFRSYLDQVLAPRLRPGHVVIMDNLKAHTVAGISEAIEATQATLLSLPSYSPDLSRRVVLEQSENGVPRPGGPDARGARSRLDRCAGVRHAQ
jgi:hypothetical protein